jgi:hypothetical protein
MIFDKHLDEKYVTMVNSFFLSITASSDLLVAPNSFLLGNYGRMMGSLSLFKSFSSS